MTDGFEEFFHARAQTWEWSDAAEFRHRHLTRSMDSLTKMLARR